jgi:uncharacterized protein YndB with AHSA1/START domain
MYANNWSRFTVRINIKATVAQIYNCWATRAGMEAWFLRLSEYKTEQDTVRTDNEPAKTGDTYKWLWHGWPDETVEYGTILQCNGQNLFAFSFGNAGNCTVKIYEEQGETITELVQENIPDDEQGKITWHIGCKTGWTFYMANLKSYLEGGIDLRNKNIELNNVLNS